MWRHWNILPVEKGNETAERILLSPVIIKGFLQAGSSLIYQLSAALKTFADAVVIFSVHKL